MEAGDRKREELYVDEELCEHEDDALWILLAWSMDVREDFEEFCTPILYDKMIEWSGDPKSTVDDMREHLEHMFVDHVAGLPDSELREYLVAHRAEYRLVKDEEVSE